MCLEKSVDDCVDDTFKVGRIVNMSRQEQIVTFLQERGSASSTEIARHMGVSRQAIHRHLTALISGGRVESRGAARGVRYCLVLGGMGTICARKRFRRPLPDEDVVFDQLVAPVSSPLAANVHDIASYSFTELFNNAIDHADASSVVVSVYSHDDHIAFDIDDDGVGCFARIMAAFDLPDARSALEQLSKGKLTTNRQAHTGEGIFFSSKAASMFSLSSNDLTWTVDNRRTDTTMAACARERGTQVSVQLDKAWPLHLEQLFAEHTDDDHNFDKTTIYVKLFERGEVFVSRSEAKRLIVDLEKFNRIVLDFSGVRSIGQGFADQLFRVWANAHPSAELTPVNANASVGFMISRATTKRSPGPEG